VTEHAPNLGGAPPLAQPEGGAPPADAPPPRFVALLLRSKVVDARLRRELERAEQPMGEGESLIESRTTTAGMLLIDEEAGRYNLRLLRRVRELHPALPVVLIASQQRPPLDRLPPEVNVMLTPMGDDKIAAQALVRRLKLLLSTRDTDRDAQPLRVLIAEDEENLRQLVTHFLILQGHEVHQAGDGVAALRLFESRRPDFMLSDVYMPRMNGFNLLLEVKQQDPGLPVLMMTGYRSASQVLESNVYPRVGFLSKPFRLQELEQRMRVMLGANR
jgi:two-component system, cell cycle response regulator CpdR